STGAGIGAERIQCIDERAVRKERACIVCRIVCIGRIVDRKTSKISQKDRQWHRARGGSPIAEVESTTGTTHRLSTLNVCQKVALGIIELLKETILYQISLVQID